MNKKRFLFGITALIIAFSIIGCGRKTDEGTNSNAPTTNSTAPVSTTQDNS